MREFYVSNTNSVMKSQASKIMYWSNKYFTDMVNHLDVHTFIYFELASSLNVSVRCSPRTTAILEFNIKPLTNSNGRLSRFLFRA